GARGGRVPRVLNAPRWSATAGRLAFGGFGGEQATVERLGHRGGAVADAELRVDVQQVRLDRSLADEQPGGRLPVGGAGRYHLQDLEFPLAERARAGRAETVHQPGRHRRREPRVDLRRGSDRSQQVVAGRVLAEGGG